MVYLVSSLPMPKQLFASAHLQGNIRALCTGYFLGYKKGHSRKSHALQHFNYHGGHRQPTCGFTHKCFRSRFWMGALLQLTEKHSFCTTKTLITIHCHKNPTFSSFLFLHQAWEKFSILLGKLCCHYFILHCSGT